jgi:hypothetical protein
MSPGEAEIHRRILDRIVNRADPELLGGAAGAADDYLAHLRRLRVRAFVKRLPVVGRVARLALDAWRRVQRRGRRP